MADIFISYSQQDREQARLLAAFLEAEGYSVWWDTSLLGGESFRKVIMTELGQARAVIAIWTENAIHSDWVASEAGRAHADRKLIPVKQRSLTHRDIPPPFDNMHIENVDDREKILAAAVAQLAKPEMQASRLQRASKIARYQLLSWFGIAGAAVTLVTNLQSVMMLARWVARAVESWLWIISFVWKHVLFFLPRIDAIDSLLLTFLSFAVVNVVMSSTRVVPAETRRHSRLSLYAAIMAVALIFWVGWRRILGRLATGDYGYYWVLIEGLVDRFSYEKLNVYPIPREWALYFVIFVLFYVLPLVPFVVAYLLARWFLGFRVNLAVLTSRLWRIVAGVALLVVLNIVSLLVEHQPWLRL